MASLASWRMELNVPGVEDMISGAISLDNLKWGFVSVGARAPEANPGWHWQVTLCVCVFSAHTSQFDLL